MRRKCCRVYKRQVCSVRQMFYLRQSITSDNVTSKDIRNLNFQFYTEKMLVLSNHYEATEVDLILCYMWPRGHLVTSSVNHQVVGRQKKNSF